MNDLTVSPLAHSRQEVDMQRTVHLVVLVLVVVGALNWGLVGLARLDLVATIFGGQDAALSRVVYALVGVAGVVLALTAVGSRADSPSRSMAAGVR